MLRLRTFGQLVLERELSPSGAAAAQRLRLSMLAILAVAGQSGVTREDLGVRLLDRIDDARALANESLALRRAECDMDLASMGAPA